MQACQQKRSRSESSLGTISLKLIELFTQSRTKAIDLNIASEKLKIPKRRLYDATNILEGLGLVQKSHINTFEWIGGDASYLLDEWKFSNYVSEDLSSVFDPDDFCSENTDVQSSADHFGSDSRANMSCDRFSDSNIGTTFDGQYLRSGSRENMSCGRFPNSNIGTTFDSQHFGSDPRDNMSCDGFQHVNLGIESCNENDYGSDLPENIDPNTRNLGQSHKTQRNPQIHAGIQTHTFQSANMGKYKMKKLVTEKIREIKSQKSSDEISRLLEEEKALDMAISSLQTELNNLSCDNKVKDLLYVSYGDLLDLPLLQQNFAFAIKAPADAYFEMNQDTQGYSLQINSTRDPIDVFFVDENQ